MCLFLLCLRSGRGVRDALRGFALRVGAGAADLPALRLCLQRGWAVGCARVLLAVQ